MVRGFQVYEEKNKDFLGIQLTNKDLITIKLSEQVFSEDKKNELAINLKNYLTRINSEETLQKKASMKPEEREILNQ